MVEISLLLPVRYGILYLIIIVFMGGFSHRRGIPVMIHPTRVKESTVLTRSVSPLARIRAIAPEATLAVWSMKGISVLAIN